MGIRAKVVVAIIVAATFGIGGGALAIRANVLAIADELDVTSAQERASHLADVVFRERQRVEATTRDWAQWDETFAFVTGAERASSFVEDNLEMATLAALRVDALAILDLDREVLLQTDRQEGQALLPSFSALVEQVAALDFGSVDLVRSGFVAQGEEVWLVGAGSITDTHAVAPISGLLIWGVLVDEARLADWGRGIATTQLMAHREGGGSDELTSVVLPTLTGEPVALDFVAGQRAREQVVASMAGLMLPLAVVGSFAAALFALWINRAVVRRIMRLRGEVDDVDALALADVTVQGRDEVTDVERSVNDLLQRLRQSSEEVRQRNLDLEQANEARDAFVSMISHELRTPLTAILGFSQTLGSHWDRIPEEQRRELLVRIAEQSRTLDGLVGDLLALRQAESSAGQQGDPAAVDASLHSIVRALPPSVLEGVQLQTGAPGAHIPLTFEALRRVVTNLLVNASKYGKAPYEVQSWVNDGTVHITVHDHGDGIDTSFVGQLFEPFTQASHGDRREARGVGLGLSIVQRLVEAAGGEVDHREGPAGGALFEIRVAACAPAPATPAVATTGAPNERASWL